MAARTGDGPRAPERPGLAGGVCARSRFWLNALARRTKSRPQAGLRWVGASEPRPGPAPCRVHRGDRLRSQSSAVHCRPSPVLPSRSRLSMLTPLRRNAPGCQARSLSVSNPVSFTGSGRNRSGSSTQAGCVVAVRERRVLDDRGQRGVPLRVRQVGPVGEHRPPVGFGSGVEAALQLAHDQPVQLDPSSPRPPLSRRRRGRPGRRPASVRRSRASTPRIGVLQSASPPARDGSGGYPGDHETRLVPDDGRRDLRRCETPSGFRGFFQELPARRAGGLESTRDCPLGLRFAVDAHPASDVVAGVDQERLGALVARDHSSRVRHAGKHIGCRRL